MPRRLAETPPAAAEVTNLTAAQVSSDTPLPQGTGRAGGRVRAAARRKEWTEMLAAPAAAPANGAGEAAADAAPAEGEDSQAGDAAGARPAAGAAAEADTEAGDGASSTDSGEADAAPAADAGAQSDEGEADVEDALPELDEATFERLMREEAARSGEEAPPSGQIDARAIQELVRETFREEIQALLKRRPFDGEADESDAEGEAGSETDADARLKRMLEDPEAFHEQIMARRERRLREQALAQRVKIAPNVALKAFIHRYGKEVGSAEDFMNAKTEHSKAIRALVHSDPVLFRAFNSAYKEGDHKTMYEVLARSHEYLRAKAELERETGGAEAPQRGNGKVNAPARSPSPRSNATARSKRILDAGWRALAGLDG